ncbi:MAG: diguanylate cyclase [Cellvibrionaceae bacterium]
MKLFFSNQYKNTNFFNCSFSRLLTILFCYSLSLTSFANSQNSVISLSESKDNYAVSTFQFLSVNTDTSIQDVIDNKSWETFSGTQRPLPSPSETSAWFKFDILGPNSSSAVSKWNLIVGWTIISHIQVHVVDHVTQNIVSSDPVGSLYDFSYEYAKAQNFSFPLPIINNRPVTVYFEIPYTRSLMPPISVMKEDRFIIQDRKDHIIIGVVFGSLIIMLLYNLSLSILLLNKTYFYYSCYMATVIMYLLPLKGLAFYSLWDGLPYLKSNGYSIAICLSFIAAALFFGRFLALKKFGGWTHYLNQSVIWIWTILLIPSIIFKPYDFVGILSLAAIFSCIAATATALRHAFAKNIMAIIFLFAWSFVLIGTVVLILLNFGVVPNNNFTANIQMFGVLLEIILLSFALAFRINQNKVQRLSAQREALELTQRVSDERRNRLLAQKESLDLQQELNSNLESQVKTRTEQLEDAMIRLEAANSELQTLSVTDSLTGIYNRRYFDEAMEQEWRQAFRDKTSISIVIADIDHFKPINDTFGHTIGDKCIQLTAKILKQSLRRPSDLLARFGGEEFIFILPGSNLKEAEKVAEHCREAVEMIQFNHEGIPVPLSISAGIATCIPCEKDNFQSLIHAADTALYKAKSAGRNCTRSVDLDNCKV